MGQECVRVCYEIDGRKERSKKRKINGMSTTGEGTKRFNMSVCVFRCVCKLYECVCHAV